VRDKDIDDEFVALFKARPKLVLTPNLPERGVKVDRGWLKYGLSPEEFAKLEKANVDDPKAQAFYGIQARNLARLNASGARIVLGANPLDDISNTRRISQVILRGVAVDRSKPLF